MSSAYPRLRGDAYALVAGSCTTAGDHRETVLEHDTRTLL